MSSKLSLSDCKHLNFYQLLNIKQTASIPEIKTAYKKRALEVHPDKNSDNPNASEIFKCVFEAFVTLKKESSKRIYDSKLYAETRRSHLTSKESERIKRMREKLAKREKEGEKAFDPSETDLAKRKIEKEIERIRAKLRKETFRESSSTHQKPLDASKIVRVEYTRKKESEKSLRLIFEHYGEIDRMHIKAESAMICYHSKSAVGKVLSDPELKDFGLKVALIKSSKRKKAAPDEAPFSKFYGLRPKAMSFKNYEKLVLNKLREAKISNTQN